ncbi:MAG: 30S ribosomal protein S9 [Bdellovibrionaceae bacterium]|nr:30S ribosomal protein S9 [Pseudobdellovibrionaceae bacterium]
MAKSTTPVYYAGGSRKTSHARIFLKAGTGKITVNKKSPEDYFKSKIYFNALFSPFQVTKTESQWDAYITVKGGGSTGQLEAIRHGISRALVIAEESYKASLKSAGFLTRDSRMVERKKYGLHKARKSTQFSKR